MSTIGGAVCIRNGNELDFCWRQAVESLLPVCDEVVICDGESTDGTQADIREWMIGESRIKLCVYPWPNPKGDIDFWVNWLNYGREHLTTDWHFQLDADEILSEHSYGDIRHFINAGKRRSATVTRYNFWKDHEHLIPEGHCCGKRVNRLAPSDMWMPSDGAHPKGAELVSIAEPTGIEIFHYGFLRKREQFFKKEDQLQDMFFNHRDPRLEQAKTFDGNWMTMPNISGGWHEHLDPYNGEHPKVMTEWLRERGYEV